MRRGACSSGVSQRRYVSSGDDSGNARSITRADTKLDVIGCEGISSLCSKAGGLPWLTHRQQRL